MVKDVRFGFRGLDVEGVGGIAVGVVDGFSPDGGFSHRGLDQLQKRVGARGEERVEVSGTK